MRDNFGRTINYLRLSVTDRCNLRCQYCMPASGIEQTACSEILRFEQMLRIVAAAARLGIRKVRITGGEPLVRKGLIDFLQKLSALRGIEEIALTTNGILLADCAAHLHRAGVRHLNISLDSLHPETFARITRGGSLQKVLRGIDSASALGMKIKLNMVAMRGVNDREICDFAALSLDKPWSVRFIEYMPTIREEQWQEHVVSGADILKRLQRRYHLDPLATDNLCGPAKPFRIRGAAGTVGIITPMTDHFCGNCNRIRITSTGKAKSCLMVDDALDLRPLLAEGQDAELLAALRQVIEKKPEQHRLHDHPESTTPFSMATIGG